MKKVVVTGGAGFIGSNLAHALVQEGYEVHVVDSLVAGKKEYVPHEAVLHEIDIRDTAALESVMRGVDTVFHLAALPRVQFSIENPVLTNEVNIGGTVSVCTAAQKGGVRRIVYSASSSAYGDQETLPLTEDMPAQPKSPYGLQKYVGELYMRVWNEVHDIETASLRYFNVYGPHLDPEGPYALVIGRFLKQRKAGEPLTITGDGEQTRDFTHVSDVVRANLSAMHSTKVGHGEVMNIGAGRNVTINQLADLLGGEKVYIEARLEPRHTRAGTGRAKELLNWEPQVTLEEGLAELKEEWGIV